jgi:ABC-type multidrug transport system ATPase subunit
VLRHDASSGAMIAGSILLGRALAPVDQILGAWRGIIRARAALARLRAAALAPPAPGFAAPPVAPMTLSLASVVVPAGPGRRPLLDRLSLTLEPGSCLGVLGPSGAGKSTLCRLLAGGVLPSFGEVRLGGVALGHLTADQRRRLIGYLPQEPTLFPGTVAENIARMALVPDAAAVSDAARLAGVHELILQLPDGYATRLGFQGAPLSGGERQRLALARALLGRPPLVVLDEPNAALDQAGEAALMDTLAALKAQGHLVVAVAHRAAFLSVADQLLVMEQGRAADFGGHDEVLGRLALRRRELRLDSRLEESARIGSWLDLQLAAPELGGVRQALEVALVEIFAHRVRRGFDGRPGQPILMRLSRDAGSVTCLVGDHGRPIGPHEIEDSARARVRPERARQPARAGPGAGHRPGGGRRDVGRPAGARQPDHGAQAGRPGGAAARAGGMTTDAAGPPLGPEIRAPLLAGLLGIVVFFLGFGGWLALAPLSHGVVAAGQLVPAGHRRAIQHLEGGIVAEIHARDGMRVKAGDLLLTLQPTRAEADRRALVETGIRLAAEAGRLRAERDGAAALAFPEGLAAAAEAAGLARILADERWRFEQRRAALARERALLAGRLAHGEAAARTMEARLAAHGREAAAVEDRQRGRGPPAAHDAAQPERPQPGLRAARRRGAPGAGRGRPGRGRRRAGGGAAHDRRDARRARGGGRPAAARGR